MNNLLKSKLPLVLGGLLATQTLPAKVLESFADVAERAIPGVVNIRTTSFLKGGRSPKLDPYQFFLQGRLPKINTTQSLGTGVIMDSRGYILTNYHVVEDASMIDVLFANKKQKVRARIVGTDPKTDLALLQAKLPDGVHPVDLGDSDKLRVGDVVLAIGNPFGYAHTVTSGIISAKGRVIGTGPYDNFLQTDAPIHPGNSGGPLIDARGRVIGINTAVASDAYGIGFAIPINIAKGVVKDLSEHGKVVRPWVGVVGKNILSADELGDQYDPSGVYGVIATNLVIDGPAHKAGLKMGDLIMGLEDEKVRDLNHLQRLLGEKSPTDRVRFKIYRRSKGFLNLTVNLTEIPKTQDLPAEKDLF
jgi:serine protease Do